MTFTGNDTSNRNYNRRVPSQKQSADLLLSWRRSDVSPVQFIACYRLDLGRLLHDGLIRKETKSGDFRVRVFHASDNDLYLQANVNGPKVRLGYFF
jgi:hypothetical protein